MLIERRERAGPEGREEVVDATEDVGGTERLGGGAHDEALDPQRRLAAVAVHDADVVRCAHRVAHLLLGAQLAEARLLDDGREHAQGRLSKARLTRVSSRPDLPEVR